MNPERLKIAFLSQPFDGVLPPRQNSIGISIYELARRLARSETVHVVTQDRPGPDQPPVQEGVTFHYLSRRWDAWMHRQYGRLARWFKFGGVDFSSRRYYLVYALRAAACLAREGFDIIHLINFSQFVPLIRAFNPRARIVLNMRCEWLSQLDRRLIARRLRQTDQIIGCSEYITGKVRHRFPELAGRCSTVHNGVDLALFHPATGSGRTGETVHLLFIGRVSPKKGVHVLIDALPAVAQRIPDLRVEILGGHSPLPPDLLLDLSSPELRSDLAVYYPQGNGSGYLATLQRKLREYGLEGRVTFPGSVPYGQVPTHIQRADLLVNPSLSESFGRSPVEAMACGVPVVAARTGGLVESVLDGQTGFLVPPGDPHSLAEAILKLLADRELRRQMGAAARQRAEQMFGWDSIAASLLQQYQALVGRRGGGSR